MIRNPIEKKYREGKVKSTLKRESNQSLKGFSNKRTRVSSKRIRKGSANEKPFFFLEFFFFVFYHSDRAEKDSEKERRVCAFLFLVSAPTPS